MSGDFVERARELLTAGQAQEAVRACRLGLLSQPGSVPGRVLLAEALLEIGRADDALAEARLALDHDGSATAAMLVQARVLLMRGDFRNATSILERAALLGADVTDLLDDARRSASKPISTPIGGVAATAGEFRAPSTVEILSGDVEDSIDVSGVDRTVQVTTNIDNSGDVTIDEPRSRSRSREVKSQKPPTGRITSGLSALLPPEGGFTFGLLVFIVLTLCAGAGGGFFMRSLRLSLIHI